MSLTIYHNPRCSKSRQTLEIIRAAGIEPKIHLYLENPLSREDITRLLGKLRYEQPRMLMRTGEAVYRELNLKSENDEMRLIDSMVSHPKLIERPIVEDNLRAIVGRPPENVQNLLKT